MIQVLETRDSQLLASLNEEIQRLHHDLYPAIFKPYNRISVLAAFDQLLTDPASKAFAAFREDKAAGYALITKKTKRESAFTYGYQLLYIDQLLVVRQDRSQGLGQVLLNRVYQEAQDLGIHRIELDHWTLNESARYFFEKAGFQYFNERMFQLL
jgi:diamine N-acetyltransferase